MKKYIIIAALSLCGNTRAMENTDKINKVTVTLTRSEEHPTRNLSRSNEQWDTLIPALIEHHQEDIKGQKSKSLDFVPQTIPKGYNYFVNQSRLFIISESKL